MFRFTLALSFVAGLSVYAEAANYGADCSFPIHHSEFRCGDLLSEQKQIYEDYMEGCRTHYGKKGARCDHIEKERLQMSYRQPQSMVNYTNTGFMKIQAPKEVRDLLAEHWEKNKDRQEEEIWPVGNIYTNHWASPTYMVSVEDESLMGAGHHLKEKIWDAARSTIEKWTGMEQKPSSMYGIRVYTEGAILSPHVDRIPLISSCIVNVAQDVDEPWPLEVYDREGNAVNVTMEPGDMVLYESGSLIHGRPFPLKGKYFANIFIHFEPTGRPLNDESGNWENELDGFYPPYLVKGSPEAEKWAEDHPHGWKKPVPSAPVQQVNSPEGHHAAATGDVDRLTKIAATNSKALHFKDENGWQPIHEAARAGHRDAVELLVSHGADMNARTGENGEGASPLNIALEFLNVGNPVTKYLLGIGAENIEDEL